jgi:hypothetical protein
VFEQKIAKIHWIFATKGKSSILSGCGRGAITPHDSQWRVRAPAPHQLLPRFASFATFCEN